MTINYLVIANSNTNQRIYLMNKPFKEFIGT